MTTWTQIYPQLGLGGSTSSATMPLETLQLALALLDMDIVFDQQSEQLSLLMNSGVVEPNLEEQAALTLLSLIASGLTLGSQEALALQEIDVVESAQQQLVALALGEIDVAEAAQQQVLALSISTPALSATQAELLALTMTALAEVGTDQQEQVALALATLTALFGSEQEQLALVASMSIVEQTQQEQAALAMTALAEVGVGQGEQVALTGALALSGLAAEQAQLALAQALSTAGFATQQERQALTMSSLAAVETAQAERAALTLPSVAMVEAAQAERAKLTATALGAPTWLSVTTAAISTPAGATTNTISYPGSKNVGDLLLLFCGADVAAGTVTFTTPTGFTAIAGVTQTQGTTTLQGYYRIVDGTEPATATITQSATGSGTAEMHLIRQQDPSVGTMLNTVNGSHAATTKNPVVTSGSPTVANTLQILIVIHDHATTSNSHTAPSGYTERTDFESSITVDKLGSCSYTNILNATGATGTSTVNCTETGAGTNACYARISVAPGAITLL